MKFHYLSESAVTILLGLVVAMGWTTIAYDETNADIKLSSNFFSLVLLPPIIFEGGYTLQRVAFFSNFFTIFGLAFAGALFSTFFCSVIMYFLSSFVFQWSFVEALVFGSLISSTDPVTVLSLLPSTVDRRLYMLIFGESALNDAVSIILYRFFTGLADPKMRLGVGPFFVSVFASAGVFLGSFLVGIIMGLIFAKITKHVKTDENTAVYEMTMLIIFAYSSYLLADVLQLTGIISIFFTGITMAHYAQGNLSEEARTQTRSTLRFLAFMCECFIFLYLGLGLLSFGHETTYDPLMIIFALFAILVSRAHVFIILGIKNLLVKTDKPIPMSQQILIWFSGLRGAVAFALGVSFLEHPTFDPQIKAYIFGTTVIVIVLTILVFGGLTPYMLVWLGIIKDPHAAVGGSGHDDVGGKRVDEYDDGEGGEDFKGGVSHGHDGHEKVPEAEDAFMPNEEEDEQHMIESKPTFSWMYHFDITYIRPHFMKNSNAPNVEKLATNSLFSKPITVTAEQAWPSSSSRKHSTASRRSLNGSSMSLKQQQQKNSNNKSKEGEEDLEVLVKKSSSMEEFSLN